MSTNDKSEEQSEDKPVTEEDLKNDKYDKEGVEGESSDESSESETSEAESEEETEGEDEEQIQDDAEGSKEQSEEHTFTKKFPNIKGDSPEEYAKNLEAAYENSTAEFHRLRQEKATRPESEESEDEAGAPPVSADLTSLFVKQEMDRKIVNDWKEFSPHYPQVSDAAEYDRFTKRVSALSKTIMSEEGRLAEPRELYTAAAASLGWEKSTQVTDEDRLGDKLKQGASVTKTNSATKRMSRSKVTDEMVALNRKLYPGKSDTEIRTELEEYVQ